MTPRAPTVRSSGSWACRRPSDSSETAFRPDLSAAGERRIVTVAGRAAYVDPVPANPSRRSRRCGGGEPPVAGPGRLHPPGRPGRFLVAAAGVDRVSQRRADRARGDGCRRLPGGPFPRAAPPRAVRDLQPVDRVRAEPVPPPGPARRRHAARADPRGDVHPDGEGPLRLLSRPAARDLPDPDQVPRRGPPARRPAAWPRVRDEGLLQLRPHRRGSGRVVPAAPRCVHQAVRPVGAAVRDRLGDVGRDGRIGVRGVPRPAGDRRGQLRALRIVWLRGQRRGGRHSPAAVDPVRRASRSDRPRHAGHSDDHHARRFRERRPVAGPARSAMDGRRHVEEPDRDACAIPTGRRRHWRSVCPAIGRST